jgi:hypothetical protein
MNTIATSHVPYTDPKLEEQFSQFESGLTSYITHHAYADAVTNQPDSLAAYQLLVGRHIRANTQKMIFAAALHLQAQTNVFSAGQIGLGESRQTGPLQLRQTQLNIDVDQMKEQVERYSPFPSEVLWRQVTLVGMGISAVLEGILSYSGWRFAGLPTSTAIVSAACVAVVNFFSTEIFGRWIKNVSGTEQLLRYAAVIITASLAFYQLADLRASARNQQILGFSVASSSYPSYCATLAIWVISVAVFVVALVASVKTSPSKEQQQQYDLYKKSANALQQLQEERATVTEEISIIEQAATEERTLAVRKHEYAHLFFDRCVQVAECVLEQYLSICKRAGVSHIDEFAHEIPPMEFIFSVNHQKPTES